MSWLQKNDTTPCFCMGLSRGSGRSRTDDDGFAIRCLSHLATEPTNQESAIARCGLNFPEPGIGKSRKTGLFGNLCLIRES